MFEGWEENDRVRVLSSVAGLLFGLGWWCFIDAASVARSEGYAISVSGEQYLPGIACTLGFFMINCIDWGTLSADDFSYHNAGSAKCKARAFVVLAVLLELSGIVGAIVIIVETYSPQLKADAESACNDKGETCSLWPGIAVLIQAVVIFVSTFIMRMGTLSR